MDYSLFILFKPGLSFHGILVTLKIKQVKPAQYFFSSIYYIHFWTYLAYPNLFGIKGFVVVVVFLNLLIDVYSRKQVGIRSITKEGREQGKRFGVEQYEMRTFSKDREMLENLVSSLSLSV
jgi:hypothetical protein